MFWIYTEEPKLLNSDISKYEAVKYITLPSKCLLIPTKKEIEENIKRGDEFYVVHYKIPEEMDFINSIFTTIEIKGNNYPFTYEQIKNNISKEEILAKKLALRIIVPEVTLDDMAGATLLKEDIIEMMKLEELGLMSISGLFLFGVAGAGKSFFAECFAGTTNRIFVVLDLPYFMSLKYPTKAIDEVFEFLLSQKDNKYLLFIDEIEKMFDFGGGGGNLISEQVFGKMLTWLNEIYGKKENNVAFVATANRIELLLQNKPEFVRKGRFDRLYFLNYPHIKDAAPDIFKLYYEKEIKSIDSIVDNKLLKPLFDIMDDKETVINYLKMRGLFDIERIIKITEGNLGEYKITNKERFVYTPPEIKSLVSSIIHKHISLIINFLNKNKIDDIISSIKENKLLCSLEEILDEIVYKSPPLQITAKEGILKQIAQAKTTKQGDRIAPFIEV